MRYKDKIQINKILHKILLFKLIQMNQIKWITRFTKLVNKKTINLTKRIKIIIKIHQLSIKTKFKIYLLKIIIINDFIFSLCLYFIIDYHIYI